MYSTGPCGLIKDKSTCQMSFNSSDCVWSDSSSICLGPERCIKPQITGKKGNLTLAECNEINGKCFPPTPLGPVGAWV